jgi:hypothetical protein
MRKRGREIANLLTRAYDYLPTEMMHVDIGETAYLLVQFSLGLTCHYRVTRLEMPAPALLHHLGLIQSPSSAQKDPSAFRIEKLP